MRVLVVDEDLEEAEALKVVLDQEGLAVDLAATTDAALVSLEEAPPDVVVSTLWVPPLTGLQLQSEVALRCSSALRLMLLSRKELHAALALVPEAEPIRFLARPWGEKTLPALLWHFVSDQQFLQLVSDHPVQGLSIEALCHEAHLGRAGALACVPAPRPAPGPASAIVGGAFVRRGALIRLVSELADERRVVVDVPRIVERTRIAA